MGALAAACFGLALAGCGEQRFDNSELVLATRATSVPPSRAFVMPPPGGPAIVSVTQRDYDNAVSQEIRLATRGTTPGENAIHAAFFTAADLPEGEGVAGRMLRVPRLDDDAIAAEMEERMPGVAMRPSAVFVQNKYGPFAYAFGHGAGGDACLYAWQRLSPGDSVFRPRSGAASIRIRLCEPRATEAALLRVAYGFAINASLSRPGWNPIGEAPGPSPTLGETGAPIYPLPTPSPGDALEAAAEPLPARPARPARRATAPVPAAETETAPPDRRLDGYPAVPPPAVPR